MPHREGRRRGGTLLKKPEDLYPPLPERGSEDGLARVKRVELP